MHDGYTALAFERADDGINDGWILVSSSCFLLYIVASVASLIFPFCFLWLSFFSCVLLSVLLILDWRPGGGFDVEYLSTFGLLVVALEAATILRRQD